jgi:hypothetical protein
MLIHELRKDSLDSLNPARVCAFYQDYKYEDFPTRPGACHGFNFPARS